MDERAAFISSICEQPEDDVRRLGFADWLDENGEGELAEFIRKRVAEPTIRIRLGPADSISFNGVEVGRGARFLRGGGVVPDGYLTYSRGFVSEIDCPVGHFVHWSHKLFREHPIDRVALAGKRPGHHTGGTGDRAGYWWEPGISFAAPRQIPFLLGEAGVDAGIWRVAFHGGLMVYVPPNSKPRGAGWGAEADALAALSATCVAYGRSLVGLPALTS